MARNFPPVPVYPKAYDSNTTLFLVYNTAETLTSVDNEAWAEDIDITPVGENASEIWAENGFANISGELFYYNSVGKDSNGKINTLKRCVRNIGGTRTKFNAAGSEVRGFVIAEHHNQLVDAVIKIENFVGEDFSEDQSTLDWRIRNLQASPIVFDDFTCPNIEFKFDIIEDNPATGILAQYEVTIDGTFTFYRLEFGDGEFTTTATSGTHRYAANANIDPLVSVSNSKCSIVQTPIERTIVTEPQAATLETAFEIKLPIIPDIPPVLVPDIPTASMAFNLPPIVTPCLELGPIGPITIPSVIEIDPPIPSIISIVGLQTIPSVISFEDFPSFPTIIEIQDPVIPSVITINPDVITFDPVNIPTLIEFGPVSFPTVNFGPAPSFPTISFGPAPDIPDVGWGPIPEIPDVGWGPIPEIPTVDFGPVPDVTVNWGPVPEMPTINFGPAPIITPLILFGPAPAFPTQITFGPHRLPSQITFGPVSIPSEITFGPAPTIPTLIEFGPAPTLSITWGPCPCTTISVVCPASPTPFAKPGYNPLEADFEDGFEADDPLEVELGSLGLPSEIKVIAPQIPDIRILHDIPVKIKLDKLEVPSAIKLDSTLPSVIKLEGELPSVIKVEYVGISSIKLDASELPSSIALDVPHDFPRTIKLDTSDLPREIQVLGVPSSIELKAPESIQLLPPEKMPEVEMVFKGNPVEVKLQVDFTRLTGEDGEDQPCFHFVPCKPK